MQSKHTVYSIYPTVAVQYCKVPLRVTGVCPPTSANKNRHESRRGRRRLQGNRIRQKPAPSPFSFLTCDSVKETTTQASFYTRVCYSANANENFMQGFRRSREIVMQKHQCFFSFLLPV